MTGKWRKQEGRGGGADWRVAGGDSGRREEEEGQGK